MPRSWKDESPAGLSVVAPFLLHGDVADVQRRRDELDDLRLLLLGDAPGVHGLLRLAEELRVVHALELEAVGLAEVLEGGGGAE